MFAFAAVTENHEAQLNFEQLARILGGGVTGATIVADANGNASWGPQVVWGTISSAGAKLTGTGFTVAHAGTGLYTITFTTAFVANPSVTANAMSGAYIMFVNSLTPTAVQLGAYSGAFADTAVSFVATGV